jgi:5'-deoxynucleotidase
VTKGSESTVANLLRFFSLAGNLKSERRRGWIKRLKMTGAETVADHTFRVALMTMVYGDLKGLDAAKAMKMAILHDLPEAIVGDATPAERPRGEKEALESAAMAHLLSFLPESLRQGYTMIWEELAVQAAEYGRGHGKRGTEEFFSSAGQVVRETDLLMLLERAKKRPFSPLAASLQIKNKDSKLR